MSETVCFPDGAVRAMGITIPEQFVFDMARSRLRDNFKILWDGEPLYGPDVRWMLHDLTVMLIHAKCEIEALREIVLKLEKSVGVVKNGSP